MGECHCCVSEHTDCVSLQSTRPLSKQFGHEEGGQRPAKHSTPRHNRLINAGGHICHRTDSLLIETRKLGHSGTNEDYLRHCDRHSLRLALIDLSIGGKVDTDIPSTTQLTRQSMRTLLTRGRQHINLRAKVCLPHLGRMSVPRHVPVMDGPALPVLIKKHIPA